MKATQGLVESGSGWPLTSGDLAEMKTPKNCGMRKAPKEAIADDQPRTGGASDLSKMTPIWWEVGGVGR